MLLEDLTRAVNRSLNMKLKSPPRRYDIYIESGVYTQSYDKPTTAAISQQWA